MGKWDSDKAAYAVSPGDFWNGPEIRTVFMLSLSKVVKSVLETLEVLPGEGIRVYAAGAASPAKFGGVNGIIGTFGQSAGYPVDLTGGSICDPMLLHGGQLPRFISH